MKTKLAIFILAAVALLPQRGQSQGSFVNLGFEQAAIVPTSGTPADPFGYSASAALPGWRLYIGANQVNWVLYDNAFLDSTGLSIHDVNSFMAPISGNYSLFIQAKYELFNNPNLIGASLAQTGLVPDNARSLQFQANAGNFQVSLNGQPLSLIPLFATPTATTYGADITPFAGTSSELRFTVNPIGAMFLDSINLSTEVVPEPRALILLLCGGMALISWRRFVTRSRA